ncbi:hypothetical protein Q8A67_020527 [Cirrhinus molitorella]|uniref:Uncharacterized protein n=1 Tax=Cirrhinus molitorella TaxID=172907 RepID=A0AA88PC18_9TELE|nr:hypothetical protein Q8A67_020527 [Cirrhinus molitorella]
MPPELHLRSRHQLLFLSLERKHLTYQEVALDLDCLRVSGFMSELDCLNSAQLSCDNKHGVSWAGHSKPSN